MVDINLLDDEDTPRNRPFKSEFNEPYDFEEPSEETEDVSDDEAWDGSSEDDPAYGGYDSPRSKNIWYIVIPFIVIAIIAVIFIWQPLFKRGTDTGKQQISVVDSSQGLDDEVPDETTSAFTPESERTPITELAQKIDILITSIPDNENLIQFSYSSGKFFVDVEVARENNLQEYLSEIQMTFPESGVTMHPRSTSSPGNTYRGLFVGNFSIPDVASQLYSYKTIDVETFRSEIRSVCETVGLTFGQISSSPLVKQADESHIPTRISAKGDKTSVLRFLQILSGENFALQYTKIIFVPSRERTTIPGLFDFVLFADLLQL